jgi:SAM-dependent methyltransferase
VIIEFLKSRRIRFLDRHYSAGDWYCRMFSAATYSLWSVSRPAMEKHCRGSTLDAGSGRGAWREKILETGAEYESLDVASRGGDTPTWIADVTDMPDIADDRYDTIVCHQVLEHVRNPGRAMREFHRVLRAQGTLILSVPHLSRRHELPHDYFRFTQEGITALSEDAGLEIVEIAAYGGILSFLHHQTSFVLPGLLPGVPVIEGLALMANAPFSWLLPALDRLIDRGALMPLGLVVVSRKPAIDGRR